MSSLDDEDDPSLLVSSSEATASLDVPSRPRSMRGGTILYHGSCMCGDLSLDSTEARPGDRLVLKWSIRQGGEQPPPVPNENDWIGMFSVDDLSPESFLDYRMRGQNLDSQGEIHWLLLDTVDCTQVCFCFYTSNNLLLAQSDTLTVIRDEPVTPTTLNEDSLPPLPLITIGEHQDLFTIKVKGLSCSGLRFKTFGAPDPFIKISVVTNDRRRPKLTHHRQSMVTSVVNSTCDPSWENEEFSLNAMSSDFLEIEVRDKFSFSRPSASHFLGKAHVSLSFLTQDQSLTKSCQLVKRLPSDRVSGTVTVTIASSNGDDLPLVEHSNTPSSLEPTREESQEDSVQEEIQVHQLPVRSSDRILWVRRTLHGDHHRRDNSNLISRQRHSSFAAPRPTPTDDNSSPLEASLHLGLEQFMARSSRNQFMRQNSCPVNRRPTPSPHPIQELGTHPLALSQSHTTAETHSHTTAETHSHTTAEAQSHTVESTVEIQSHSIEPQSADIRITEPQPHDETQPQTTTETQTQTTAETQTQTTIETQTQTTIETQTQTVESHTDDTSPPSTPLSPVIILSEGNSTIDSSTEEERGGAALPTPPTNISLMVPPSFSRIDSVDDSMKDHPGFLFITRNDFYEFVKSTGSKVFLQDLSLLKLVQSIRSDHSLYSKYSHSSRLVRAINSFALVDCELPDGWEKRLEKESQKVVFVDHNSQSTTFIDPRLPLPGRRLNTISEHGVMRSRPIHSTTPQRSSSNPETTNSPRTRPGRSETTPTTAFPNAPIEQRENEIDSSTEDETSPQTYSAKIVNFLRQPGIYDILACRYEGDLTTDLRSSIDQIRSEGVPRLERLQNEADEVYFELTIVLSLFEEDISHQLFATQQEQPSVNAHISRSSLPPPSLVPPPPPSHAPTITNNNTPPDMDIDEDHYAGIPLIKIIEFFQQDATPYHAVLARFGRIQPHMREFIQAIAASTPDELADELYTSLEVCQFIYELRNDIQESIQTTTSDTTTDTPDTRDDEEGIPPSSDIPTAAQVRAFMAQPDILIRLNRLDPDERSIVQVCGTWDLSLIDFELNRNSVLRDLVMRIATDIRQFSQGSGSLEQSSNDNSNTLNITSSPPPPPPPPPPLPSTSFVTKLQQLQSILDVNGYGSYGQKELNVRREHLLEDAYRLIMRSSAKSLRTKGCHVTWSGEEGLDYGGPQREFFFKLSRLLFNPFYGLFEYTAHGAYTVQISRYSSNIDDAHLWFRFAGRVIGYALIQNQLLDVFFARHVYKSLLDIPFTVSDVETLDLSFYNSLQYVLEDDPAPLELTFTVPEESFGEIIDKELKPGGAEISVTEENKKEYVDLMTTWRLTHGIQQQMKCLVSGLKEMIPLEYLKTFDARELEWVIAGTPEINMEDWKKNTQYWGGYHDHHNVIEWFWEAMESFSNEQKLKFLQFTTGTSSIPYEGFKALRGSSQQLQKFTIDRFTGPVDSLINAHTCFNRIDLPPYRSLQEMKDKLLYAILETDSFESA